MDVLQNILMSLFDLDSFLLALILGGSLLGVVFFVVGWKSKKKTKEIAKTLFESRANYQIIKKNAFK